MLNSKIKATEYKDINGIRFFDTIAIFDSIAQSENINKLSSLMKNTGVSFYDENYCFIKKPSVGLIGLGGLAFNLSSEDSKIRVKNTNAAFTTNEISKIFEPLQASGGFMSYLNTGNLTPPEMIEIMHTSNHLSTLHMSYINIGIFGISSLVENEFNCQRDLIHLARITEARASVQDRPPISVLYPEFYDSYKKVYDLSYSLRSKIASNNLSKKDMLESVNAMYPASKATALIISGSLRNIRKLTDLLGDNGKEEEMKRILAMINDFCHQLWPQFFNETSSYNFTPPSHWNESNKNM